MLKFDFEFYVYVRGSCLTNISSSSSSSSSSDNDDDDDDDDFILIRSKHKKVQTNAYLF